ncbi:MAG: FkbM family methyltransferase [Pseudomonadota bacterium]|nr:FkbM family methyltransferase [Pseudomonadota bacterium]
MIPVDDKSQFGSYEANRVVALIINITRSLGSKWISKRLIFILRRIAIYFSKQCLDTVLFDSNLRLYTKGNISEKRALFSPQIFEEEERNFIASRASDNSIFIDIGANVGLYSFSISQKYKLFENTKIFALEPHPDLFKRLLYNQNLNSHLPIFPKRIAIMHKPGEFFLNTPKENLGQGKISQKGELKVEGLPLSNFAEIEGIKKISAIKIDVEGNEEKVLLPFIIEENRSLFPDIFVIENNKDLWKTDLIGSIIAKGFSVKMKTRMNFILKKNKR